MRGKHMPIRVWSCLSALLLVFSMLGPAANAADSIAANQQHHAAAKTAVQDKFSDRLLDNFAEEDEVTFLIKFQDKANTSEAAEKAREKAAKAGMERQKTELMQREKVISELQTTAEESQTDVQAYLETEAEKNNAKNIRSYYIVNGIAVTASKEVAEKAASFDEVEKILPNAKRQLIKTPEQEEAPKAGAMDDVGGDIEWNVDRINAPEAWNAGADGSGTVVASIDSGADWKHPALQATYRGNNPDSGEVDHTVSWYDAVDGNSEPYDDVGHGTHVTGTMTGSESDGSNQIGVAPGAEWIAVKAFSESGGTDTDLLDAAEWILAPTDSDGEEHPDMAPDIVNNSWGGGPGMDEWYRDVVRAWRDANILPVFAAGNVDADNRGGPGSIATPANYPESFAVGATDIVDLLASFSLEGPSPYDEIKPDITAPGQEIRSALPDGGYSEDSGTSMAAPAVSGAAALIRSFDSSLSVNDLEELLKDTATPLTDEDYPDSPNNGYGHGLADAHHAILAAENGIGSLEGTVTDEDGEPLDANVKLTGPDRSTDTSPDDGTYSIQYAAGEYTAEADAYGYEVQTDTIELEKEQTTTKDFRLKAIPERTISGDVTDAQTGEAIEGASISLVDDPKVTPVETDETGHYDLTAHEGDYTMRITASGFKRQKMDVSFDKSTDAVDIELEPFYGYEEDELAYDDGTGDGGSWFQQAGSGWGVRMSLAEDQERALVTGGKFLFSERGGDDFQVEVFDSSGPDGAPGERIAGPIDATAVKDGTWTTVDLKNEGIVVEDDFYIVYMQTEEKDDAPRLEQDKSDPFTGRSWENYHGYWYQLEEGFLTGNKMIRALVDYEVDEPVITEPEEGDLTNETDVTVQGVANPDTTIQLRHNGEKAGTGETDTDGNFSLEIELSEGENELTAVTLVDGDETKSSETVSVTLDTESPALTIDSHEGGETTNRETATIEGSAADDHLASVEVNGKSADVSDDGTFSRRILLDEGENTVEVTAEDQAGNVTTETVTLHAKWTSPDITDLTPEEDQDVKTGETVRIEFDSEAGLDATFSVNMPLTVADAGLSNATELPMRETGDGHYVGYWIVPAGLTGDGATVVVKATDAYGNETRERADGNLRINGD